MDIKQGKTTLYLVSGKARHGKDTFSGYLKEAYEKDGKKVIITQMSKYIKYYAREMTGWNLTEEDKPRSLLQTLGTDIIREKLGMEDLFIKRMIDDIKIFSCFYDAIIISDVRLKLEMDMLKNAYPDSIGVNIFRPDFDNGLTEEQKKHKTEVDLDDYDKFDLHVINTTLDKLKESAENLYTNIEK